MNSLVYSLFLILTFAFVSDAHQSDLINEFKKSQFIPTPRVGRSSDFINELKKSQFIPTPRVGRSSDFINEFKKSQFIPTPRVGRSSDIVNSFFSGHIKSNSQSSIPINKILNHIYSDLLKRQGYIPTPRVGRSFNSFSNLDHNKVLDFFATNNQINPSFPAAFLKIESASTADRFKRSPLIDLENSDQIAYENLDNYKTNSFNNIKRQFLPPPRIGRRSDNSQLTKETLASDQLSSNVIDSQNLDDDHLSNIGSYLQEESNQIEPIDLRTMSKLLKWMNLGKNKQLIANALNEKRATFNSRLGRSAPLTPRLGRSYSGELNTDQDSGSNAESNDRYYESSLPINNRIVRTALTPRIGKR